MLKLSFIKNFVCGRHRSLGFLPTLFFFCFQCSKEPHEAGFETEAHKESETCHRTHTNKCFRAPRCSSCLLDSRAFIPSNMFLAILISHWRNHYEYSRPIQTPVPFSAQKNVALCKINMQIPMVRF